MIEPVSKSGSLLRTGTAAFSSMATCFCPKAGCPPKALAACLQLAPHDIIVSPDDARTRQACTHRVGGGRTRTAAGPCMRVPYYHIIAFVNSKVGHFICSSITVALLVAAGMFSAMLAEATSAFLPLPA